MRLKNIIFLPWMTLSRREHISPKKPSPGGGPGARYGEIWIQMQTPLSREEAEQIDSINIELWLRNWPMPDGTLGERKLERRLRPENESTRRRRR